MVLGDDGLGFRPVQDALDHHGRPRPAAGGPDVTGVQGVGDGLERGRAGLQFPVDVSLPEGR